MQARTQRLNLHGGRGQGIGQGQVVARLTEATSIQGTRARMRLLKKLHKIELGIIDYYQLLSGNDVRMRRYDQLVEVSRGLKLLANELDIPIIVLAQLNAEGQSAERPPQVTDIEECKRLYKDCNVFILLDRPYERMKNDTTREHKPDPCDGEIDVAAIRSRATAKIPAKYYGHIQRWQTDEQNVTRQELIQFS